ncbi:polyprenyl synthetase family protein [Nonomuraea sp. KM90]|uniref:polyprenyl synthetase family protein n=1 Tax=Nonomuraea sp. KM90 TaxID=3457428 RepID=UPI003FCE2D65
MNTVTSRNNQVRELVDRHLAWLLDEQVERLGFLDDPDVELVRAFLVEFVLNGGKRLRPTFVSWGFRAAGGERPAEVLPAACTVELVHAAAPLETGPRLGAALDVYTVERPLHLGHAVAGGCPRTRRLLSAYAPALGEALQLRDDVNGVFGDPARTGKPAGADLLQGKATFLLAEARRRTGSPLLDGVAGLDRPPGSPPEVRQALAELATLCAEGGPR